MDIQKRAYKAKKSNCKYCNREFNDRTNCYKHEKISCKNNKISEHDKPEQHDKPVFNIVNLLYKFRDNAKAVINEYVEDMYKVNTNVMISSLKTSYCHVYTQEGWIVQYKKNILIKLTQRLLNKWKKDISELKINNPMSKIDKNTLNSWSKYHSLNQYSNTIGFIKTRNAINDRIYNNTKKMYPTKFTPPLDECPLPFEIQYESIEL